MGWSESNMADVLFVEVRVYLNMTQETPTGRRGFSMKTDTAP